ncbi:hypothetical protein FB473_000578 [Brooklawnia cerclae]|uniref:Uncharacterized protein n=1 Tax=Brooklawnia cerclae TaxID=349934 RepID=A0ABX0SC20_9ACTN|nr:hypothetical protein [Brooklawnia cerclae]
MGSAMTGLARIGPTIGHVPQDLMAQLSAALRLYLQL